MVYNTSNYPKNIATIKADVRPTTGSIYKAGIYTVNSLATRLFLSWGSLH